jgi:hypothetical protein
MVNAVLNPANNAQQDQAVAPEFRAIREPAVNARGLGSPRKSRVMSSISFWAQNQAAHGAAAAAHDRIFNDTSVSKLFTGGNPSASKTPNVMSTESPYAVINTFGQVFLNSSLSRAILAAQEGNDRVKALTAKQQGNGLPPPSGDLSSQVTFSGSLGVNFGPDGPAQGGGYHFVSGAALKANFKASFGAKMSNGEFIDTYSILGNTLTGSTSGPDAHDVFTLTLHPDSGLYTFKLLAPIDQKTTKGSFNKVFLNSLFQAVSSTGQKQSIPTVEMDVYNDYGSVQSQGNWALLHEGSLTYKDPNSVTLSNTDAVANATGSSTSAAKAYTVPTDPRTTYGYTTSTSAGLGVINSVNIFS